MRKFCAAFFCLILTLTLAPLSLRAETPAISTDTTPPLSNLAVPEEIGKVQERFKGSAPRTIIQIQDVHAHAVAQQNIAAILERLRVVFGIETAALEGAWAATSLPKSHALPTSREKQLLAGTLLEDDRISGPVYAAIMSPEPVTLIGIEDEISYERNRALFLSHLGKAGATREKLRSYSASLQELQRSAWGPELLAFGTAFGKFREASDLGKFFPVLLKTAETQGLNASDLSQIILLRDIMTLEKSFAKERLEREVKNLMREYKNTPWTLEELVRGGKIPSEKLGLYPEIKKLMQLYKLRDQISLGDLTAQIEALTGRLIGKLALSPEENALWDKTERFYLAERLLLLQASPADIKALENEKSALETELASAGLAEALALSLDFYALVQKRDEIFFNKIMTDPALAGDIAIVTGGFHTEGLSERFRAAGISYITIAPQLGGAGMNEKIYNERMAEPPYKDRGFARTPQRPGLNGVDSPTLSELRNAIAWIDDRFPESYEVLLQTRDVRKAEKSFLGETVVVSRPSRIAHLSREGRIAAGTRPGTVVNTSELRVSDFAAKPHAEQLQTVRGWLAQGPERREKAMLVSSVSILARILSEEKAKKLLAEAVHNGDIVALAQDVPVTEMPAIFSSLRGINRFETADISTLIEKTPRFQRLAKKHPFAIMENGRPRGAYVVLPEKSVSLVLFRIVTLNPSLYQAAKDPAFLALLEDLLAEILSQELSGKAA